MRKIIKQIKGFNSLSDCTPALKRRMAAFKLPVFYPYYPYLSIFSRSPEEANFHLKYWNWDETTETQISFTYPTIALDEDSLLREEQSFNLICFRKLSQNCLLVNWRYIWWYIFWNILQI